MKEWRTCPRSLLVFVALLSLSFLFLTQQEAYTYIDPGSGSIILQLLAGIALGALFALKMYWRRAKNFISRVLLGRKPAGGEDDSG